MSTTADLMGLGMSPALAARLGNTPGTIAGVGQGQSGAAVIGGQGLNLLSPTSGNTAFILNSSFSTGRPVYVWNTSATNNAWVFPPSGGSINGGTTNGLFLVPALSGGIFQLTNGSGNSAEAWYCVTSANGFVTIPQITYNAVSTAPTTNNLNLTGANITGGSNKVVLNLTAALSAGATATLPTVAALVTAMQVAGLNPAPGGSYELDICNTSSGNFAWTATTNTGWGTLQGTAQTIAQNTYRAYSVTFTSLAAAVLQSLGEITLAGNP